MGAFDEAPGTLQSSGVRADVQCCKIDVLKWLEELVSQSNTIQAQEDMGPKLFMATTGFKHEMLRIYLSDHDAELE